MHDAEHQEKYEMEPLDEFEVELSDLPPSSRGHYMLLRLHTFKKNLREARQAFFASDELSVQSTVQTGSQGDEDEVEISDLPPSTRSHYRLLRLIAFKKRLQAPIQQFFAYGSDKPQVDTVSPLRASRQAYGRLLTRARMGQLLTTFGICVALLILLLGNDPALPNQLSALVHPAATSAVTSSGSVVYTSVPIVNVNPSGLPPMDRRFSRDSLGSLPATCPQADSLQQFPISSDPPPPGMGNRLLWVTGFTGPVAALRDLRPTPPGLQIQGGFLWAATLNLFIRKGYNEDFTLQGADQLSGEHLQFSDTGTGVAGPVFSFGLQDLATQSLLIDDGQWELLPVNVYLPRAGCYFLEFDWSYASQVISFAAGR